MKQEQHAYDDFIRKASTWRHIEIRRRYYTYRYKVLRVNAKAMTVILAKWSWSDHPNNGQSQDEYGNGLKKTLEYLDLKPELFDLNIGLLDSSKVVSWKHMQHLGCKWWGTRKYPVITKVPSSLLTSKFCPTPTGIAGDDTIYRTIIPNKVLIVWDKEPQIVWTEGWVVTKGLGWVKIVQTKKQFENSSLYLSNTHPWDRRPRRSETCWFGRY